MSKKEKREKQRKKIKERWKFKKGNNNKDDSKNSNNNNKNARTAFIEIENNPKKSQKNKLLKRAEKWIKKKTKLVQSNLRSLFTSQHFQKILKFLKCLKYAGKSANQINNLLKNHLTLIGDIVTKGYIGRIPLYIVNIICNWEHFKKKLLMNL